MGYRPLLCSRDRQLVAHSQRLARMLPRLMEEFHAMRDPKEVLDCADALLSCYEETAVILGPNPSLVSRHTSECLRAGTCEGLARR